LVALQVIDASGLLVALALVLVVIGGGHMLARRLVKADTPRTQASSRESGIFGIFAGVAIIIITGFDLLSDGELGTEWQIFGVVLGAAMILGSLIILWRSSRLLP
jgi:uncharacterized protein YjeT (DUF2065 family)